MDAALHAVAELLLTSALWVGIPCLLLAVLLTLGLRIHNRFTALVLFLGVTGVALWAAALSIDGLVTGEAMTISRSWGTVRRVEHPIYFWVATAFWFALSVALVAGTAWALARRFLTANQPLNRTRGEGPPRAG